MKVSVFLFLFFPLWVFAQGRVTTIHHFNEVLVDVGAAEGFIEGQRVVVLSMEKDQIVAIGEVRDDSIEGSPGIVKVRILEVVDNILIMPNDSVELLSYQVYRDKKSRDFILWLDGYANIGAKHQIFSSKKRGLT